MTYRDFDLLVERTGAGLRARVLASPAGTASAEFRLPLTDVQLENFLLRVGRSRRTVRRAESSELQAAKNFGAMLFAAVFSGEVAVCFRKSAEEARRKSQGLRIRLRLGDASLADLPWEYLYSPTVNRFTALSIQTPLVRYVDLPDPIGPISVTPPIRALVMISSPADYPQLDVEGEWSRLNEALGDLVRSSQLVVDRLDNATLSALQRQLRQESYHIFHFIGHGEFDQAAQEGVLILKDDEGRGHRVGSQSLGMLLHDHSSLRVAILNACEGARTSAQDPFAGSAQTLVQQGIPAVIAMQFEIADEVAATFAHEFYGALSDGYPIDAAVTEARKAIFAAGNDVEWATPVLYLRAPDGRIFDLDHRPSRPASAKRNALSDATVLIRDAGVALAHGKYEDALKYLRVASTHDPNAPNLQELIDTAEQQRAVAETRARLRSQLRDHVSAAADLFAKGETTAASVRVQEALKLKADDTAALALETQIRQAPTRALQRARAAERGQHPPSKVLAMVDSKAPREGRRTNGEDRKSESEVRPIDTDSIDTEKDLLD
jgi:CHAT domain